MERTFKEALRHRRSYYALAPESPVEDAQIEEIVRFAIKHVPSAFNSQSTRAVLLLHEHHEELWKIVKRTLRAIVPEDAFARTEEKIERSFAAGYGTVLFFEDTNVVRDLQQKFPGYAGNFPVWSEQTSAMHQLAIWTMLEDAGFGASLQHYNPLIDNEVRKRWSLPEEWRLIAQMPFGTPAGERAKRRSNRWTNASGCSDKGIQAGFAKKIRRTRRKKFEFRIFCLPLHSQLRNTPCGNSSVGRAQPCQG